MNKLRIRILKYDGLHIRTLKKPIYHGMLNCRLTILLHTTIYYL